MEIMKNSQMEKGQTEEIIDFSCTNILPSCQMPTKLDFPLTREYYPNHFGLGHADLTFFFSIKNTLGSFRQTGNQMG